MYCNKSFKKMSLLLEDAVGCLQWRGSCVHYGHTHTAIETFEYFRVTSQSVPECVPAVRGNIRALSRLLRTGISLWSVEDKQGKLREKPSKLHFECSPTVEPRKHYPLA